MPGRSERERKPKMRLEDEEQYEGVCTCTKTRTHYPSHLQNPTVSQQSIRKPPIVLRPGCGTTRSLKHIDWILSHVSSMDTYNVEIGYMITSSRILVLFVRVGPGSGTSKPGYDNGNATAESSMAHPRRPSSCVTPFDK
jgi:hypothetical protein